ncbi:MAG: hypothetical protein KJ774_03215 [Firmicutes bacterium]|nr:hypothetical protein [Bacillota bacterium]
MFADPETGLSVPILMSITGEDFFDAIDNARDDLLLADRLADEGLSILNEPVKKTA